MLNRNIKEKTWRISVELHKRLVRFGEEEKRSAAKGGIVPEGMIERGARLHRSTVGQTEIGTACLKRSRGSAVTSHERDDPSTNVTPHAALLDR